MKKMLLFLLVYLWAVPTVAYSQGNDTCPEIVASALEATDGACRETGRNQVCYGNITLIAEVRDDVDAFTFEQQGDIVNVIDIETLTLSSMNTDTEEWGVMLMRIQANLPDTLPGQNTTFIVFGNVEIEDRVQDPADDSQEEDTLSPLQAFLFKSGIGDAPCEGAPDSGILVQTPVGQGEINFIINEVSVTLGSTVFLQAEVGDRMTVSTLEGTATLTAFDVTKTAVAGTRIHVPLDDDGVASGPPGDPEPYDMALITTLPVSSLEYDFEIVPPQTINADDNTDEGTPIVPKSGDWEVASVDCSHEGLMSSFEVGMTLPSTFFESTAEMLESGFQDANNGGEITVLAEDSVQISTWGLSGDGIHTECTLVFAFLE